MSLLKLGGLQVGQSNTASNNFHWRNLLDGLLRLSRGNAGSPITDVMRVKADNSVEFPGGVYDPRTVQNLALPSDRAANITYTNTDAFPRMVCIGVIDYAGSTSLLINGVVFSAFDTGGSGADFLFVQGEVPPGFTYKLETSGSLTRWVELKV